MVVEAGVVGEEVGGAGVTTSSLHWRVLDAGDGLDRGRRPVGVSRV